MVGECWPVSRILASTASYLVYAVCKFSPGLVSLPTSGLGSSGIENDGIFFKKYGPSLRLLLKYWKGDALSSGVTGMWGSLPSAFSEPPLWLGWNDFCPRQRRF